MEEKNQNQENLTNTQVSDNDTGTSEASSRLLDAYESQNAEPKQNEAEAYSRYYEPMEDPKKKRRGIGGYILTAVISFVIGALFASLFISSSASQLNEDNAIFGIPGFSFEITPSQSAAPEQSADAPAQKAEPTPLPTTRPTPPVDGTAPSIQSGSVNPIPEIVEQVSPGVIGVNGYAYNEKLDREAASSLGTGFIFSSEGYVMTCEHIIRDASRITVTMSDGAELDAELMGADKTMDVAVLKIDADNLCTLKMGNSDSLRVGDYVIAIGDPTGRELSGTTTFGIVSAVSRTVNIQGSTNTYIQTDAAVNPGSSGGALLNMNGEVVGLTSAKTVTADYDEYGNAISAEGLGFATPINTALDTAMQLITQGYVRHPGIGISVITMDAQSAVDYDVPEGIVVYSVTKDGPGEKAGLKVNDIILTCNGEPIEDQSAFVEYIRTCHVGDELKLKVWRYGEEIETTIVLGDLNDMGSEIVNDEYADFEFNKDK